MPYITSDVMRNKIGKGEFYFLWSFQSFTITYVSCEFLIDVPFQIEVPLYT